jgi:hypothetical protein
MTDQKTSDSVEQSKSEGGITFCTPEIFSSDSHLKEIDGFRECTSLCQIEIPSSVEVIGPCGFWDSLSLRVIIIRARCQLRITERLQWIRPFAHYEDEDMKHSRLQVHLGIGERNVLDNNSAGNLFSNWLNNWEDN